MKIAIACDHRGFEAKRRLLPTLKKLGHEVQDFGCEGSGSVDYPDYGLPVSKDVAAGVYEVGILLDGSGIGMSVVANKVTGIRAALVHDEVTARRALRDNHRATESDAGVNFVGQRQAAVARRRGRLSGRVNIHVSKIRDLARDQVACAQHCQCRAPGLVGLKPILIQVLPRRVEIHNWTFKCGRRWSKAQLHPERRRGCIPHMRRPLRSQVEQH